MLVTDSFCSLFDIKWYIKKPLLVSISILWYMVINFSWISAETFELWPTYKVEKLRDARGRRFVCEVTSPEFHLFLSGNSESDVDVLVFLLQVQTRLKDDVRGEDHGR